MLPLCLVLATTIAGGVSPKPPESAAIPLVGAWRLVGYEDRPEEGPPVLPFGKNPRGLLIYGSSGQMSIQIMKQPHRKVASGSEVTATAAEKQALFDSFMAYFGTYTVDSRRGVVVHHVEGDLWGVFDGRDEARPFELSGDRLTLHPRWESGGRRWEGIRTFERLGPRDVEAATTAFHQALRTNDADALFGFVAEDVVMMPPGEADVRGKAAMRAWYAGFLSQFRTTSLELTGREVFVDGGWAVETGAYAWGLAPAGGGEPVVDRGRYMQVWKAQPDGQWRFAREIWNSSAAPPVAPAAR